MSCPVEKVPPIDYSCKDFGEVADKMQDALAQIPGWEDFGSRGLPDRIVTSEDFDRWLEEPFRDKDLMFELALDPEAFVDNWRRLMKDRVPAGIGFDLEFRDGRLCATILRTNGTGLRMWTGPEGLKDREFEEFDNEDFRK